MDELFIDGLKEEEEYEDREHTKYTSCSMTDTK